MSRGSPAARAFAALCLLGAACGPAARSGPAASEPPDGAEEGFAELDDVRARFRLPDGGGVTVVSPRASLDRPEGTFRFDAPRVDLVVESREATLAARRAALEDGRVQLDGPVTLVSEGTSAHAGSATIDLRAGRLVVEGGVRASFSGPGVPE